MSSLVRLELQRLGRIDLTGALVLRDISRDLGRAGTAVAVSGVGVPLSYARAWTV